MTDPTITGTISVALGDGRTATATLGPTTVTGTVSPSGQAMPTGDLPGWKQVVAEDFDSDATLGALATTSGTGAVKGDYSTRITCYPDSWSLYAPGQTVSMAGNEARVALD